VDVFGAGGFGEGFGRGFFLGAGGAKAVEGHFVVFDEVAAGDDGAAGEVQGADVEIEDVFAMAALEVIVMAEAGTLVAGLAVREDDGPDALGAEEEIEGPVDGGDAEAAKGALGALEDLLDGYRTLGLCNGLEDGIPLAGMTLAERGRHGSKVMAGAGEAQGRERNFRFSGEGSDGSKGSDANNGSSFPFRVWRQMFFWKRRILRISPDLAR
jgi:hypothetical protein